MNREAVPAAVELDQALLRQWPLPSAEASQSKEDRGRVLVIAGASTIPGACLLAGIAALRAGAGKLQVAVVAPAAMHIAVRLPEAKVMSMPVDDAGEMQALPDAVLRAAAGSDAVVFGPGMAAGPAMVLALAQLFEQVDAPIVLDAGALDAYRGRSHPRAVLTPHPGEMARMVGMPAEEVEADAASFARRHARDHGHVLVLKGSTTHIAAPDGRLWIHRGGSPGLGTSGSGDVLAGVVGGLLARGAYLEQAACWAVSLHAQAGRRLEQRHGSIGLLAREIAGEVPALMHSLRD
ncbi:MAG TPA: NAD(P)H-hydrate dehydratase [Pseudoxanthomonas sp.]|nr:NAD(P)H-hydrate dehydratase [Pseudoxanthomonas sp.]